MAPTNLTTPLTWLGAAPPTWLAPYIKVGPLDEAEVVATHGDPAAVEALRKEAPGALVVAVVPECTPELELSLLEAGASVVVDGRNPALDEARVNALVRPRRRTRSRIRALELSISLLRVAGDEDAFLQQLSAVIADELDSDRVSIMQLDADRRVLVMRAAVGISAEVVAKARTPVGQGIAGVAAQTGQPIYVDDHARIRAGVVSARELAQAAAGTPMSLTVPIKVRGSVVGVVNVTDRRDKRPYGRRDITFIDYLTREVGFLLENARLMSRLQRLMAFNESVIDTIHDPLVVIDTEQRVTSTNRRFESLFGAGDGALLFDVLPLDAEHQAQLAQLIEGAPVSAERRAAWPIGGCRFDVTATRFEADGRPMCLVLLRDVTDRVDRERRLVEAEKMASLGVLAAGIAHEINNPLGWVKSNTNSAHTYLEDLIELAEARRPPVDLAQAEQLEDELAFGDELRADIANMKAEIDDGIGRIKHIVASLKSFVHADTDEAREAQLNDLIQRALIISKGKWKQCLEVELDLADHLAPIACLPIQIEQVFVNLVVNACQAGDGQRRLRIASNAVEDGVRVTFTDNCGGIPHAVRDRVFEPFFTTKDIGEGSGLGLAISRNIIAAHGGTLSFEVEDGVGTAFSITLPRGEAGKPLVVKQLSRYRV